MRKFRQKIEYERNIKLGLILSLGLMILIFLYYPYPSPGIDTSPVYSERLITVVDIPNTDQESAPQMTAQAQPKPIVPSMLFEVDDLEILEDVKIDDNTLQSSENIGDATRDSDGDSGPRVLSSLPFVPRQVLWVVPSKDEDIDGFITFSLHIGTNGMVKEHRVIKNTIEQKKFVDNVIASIYKCKWAPVVMEGEKVEFWIELTYQ